MAGPVTPIAATSAESDPFTSILNAWNQLSPTFLGSGTTNTTDTQTSGVSPDVAATLQSLLGNSSADVASGQYSKANAIADSQGQIQQIIKDGLQKNMPSIGAAAHGAGVYNDTTTSLLTNDLQARIAAQAAAAVQQNIANYAKITNDATNAAANVGKAIGTTTTNNSTKSTTPAASVSKVGGVAGGALTALSLASKLGLVGKNPAASLVAALGKKNPIDASLNTGMDGGTGAMDSGTGMQAGYDSLDSPTSSITSTIGDDGTQSFSNALAGDSGNGLSSAMDFSGDGGGEAVDALSSLGSDLGSSVGILGASDLGSSADIFGQSGADVLGGMGGDAPAIAGDASDVASNGGDLWGSLASGAGSLWDSAGDFFGGLFADGGRVPTKDQVNHAGRIITAHVATHDYTPPASADKGVGVPGNKGKPQRAFADGGTVIPSSDAGRSSPTNIYDQNALSAANPTTSGALTQQVPASSSGPIIAPVANPATRPSTKPVNVSSNLGPNTVTRPDQEANGSGDGTAGNSAAGMNSNANMGGVLGGMVSAALGVATGNPIGLGMGLANAISNAITGHSVLGNVAISILGDDKPTSLPSAASPGDGNASQGPSHSGSVSISGDDITNSDITTGSDSSSSSGIGADNSPGDGGMGSGAPGGIGGADGGEGQGSGNAGGIGGADGAADGGDSSGGDGGAGASGGDGGDGGAYKDGGEAGGKLPGHDTKGEDKINIKVSGGEYIMPTDVVDHLGVGFFDRLKDAFHKPIGGK